MVLKELIDDYLNKKFDSEFFQETLNSYYHNLLFDGKFQELEYLKVYPMIVELQNLEMCEREEVRKIQDIMYGENDYSYALYIKVDAISKFSKMYEIWEQYKNRKIISITDIEWLKKEYERYDVNTKYIGDLYIKKLILLLSELPLTENEELTFNVLYASEVNEIDVHNDIQNVIDILYGNKLAYVTIKYEKGFISVLI